MISARSALASSALAGASLLSGCASLEHHVVMGTLEINGKPVRTDQPHHYTLASCIRDGQAMFDRYGREDFKKASAAKPDAKTEVVWRCRDWIVTSGKGFELHQVGAFIPKP